MDSAGNVANASLDAPHHILNDNANDTRGRHIRDAISLASFGSMFMGPGEAGGMPLSFGLGLPHDTHGVQATGLPDLPPIRGPKDPAFQGSIAGSGPVNDRLMKARANEHELYLARDLGDRAAGKHSPADPELSIFPPKRFSTQPFEGRDPGFFGGADPRNRPWQEPPIKEFTPDPYVARYRESAFNQGGSLPSYPNVRSTMNPHDFGDAVARYGENALSPWESTAFRGDAPGSYEPPIIPPGPLSPGKSSVLQDNIFSQQMHGRRMAAEEPWRQQQPAPATEMPLDVLPPVEPTGFLGEHSDNTHISPHLKPHLRPQSPTDALTVGGKPSNTKVQDPSGFDPQINDIRSGIPQNLPQPPTGDQLMQGPLKPKQTVEQLLKELQSSPNPREVVGRADPELVLKVMNHLPDDVLYDFLSNSL